MIFILGSERMILCRLICLHHHYTQRPPPVLNGIPVKQPALPIFVSENILCRQQMKARRL